MMPDGGGAEPRRSLDEKREQLRHLLQTRIRASPQVGAAGSSERVTSDDEGIPISPSQRALWFLQQLDPESAALNIATVLPLPSDGTGDAVQAALEAVVQRHPLLRATIRNVRGKPMMHTQSASRVLLTRSDASSWTADEYGEAASSLFDVPFDLQEGPLLRAHRFNDEGRGAILLLVVHHIVCDTVSLHIVSDEILHLLDQGLERGLETLEPLPTTFAAYTQKRNQRLEGKEGEHLWDYWRDQFPDGLPTLDLGAIERPAPLRRAVHTFAWSGALPRRIESFARQEETTPFVTLLAAFAIVLQRYTQQDVIPVGTAVHGRGDPEAKRLVGYLAGSVLLGLDLSGDPTFRQLTERVQSIVWGALEHQSFPLVRLVERLRSKREASDVSPLQVQFVHQQAAALRSFGGWRREAHDAPLALPAHFASLLTATMHRGGEATLSVEMFTLDGLLLGGMAYDADVFERETVQALEAGLSGVLEFAIANPDAPLSSIAMRPRAEVQVTTEAQQAVRVANPERSVHSLFEAQVARDGQATALECGEAHWSYAELDARANAIAHALKVFGPEAILAPIALYLERSPAFVAAMLGVLKAGGCYLPVDVRQPEERTQTMLSDAGVRVVLADGDALLRTDGSLELLRIDQILDAMAAFSPAAPGVSVDPAASAYVIYTSGSTGAPKGVVIPHRAIVRLVVDADYAPLRHDDRVAHLSNVAFDAATFEVWGALLNGGTLVLMDDEILIDPARFAEWVRASNVTTAFVTTALFNLIAQTVPDAFRTLRRLLFGGEKVDPSSVACVLQKGPPDELIHVYGPTENTTFTTWHRVVQSYSSASKIPIGRAVSGAEVYVLDAARQPVPDGFPGELYVGGAGLATGYLNNAEGTAAAFVPSPFHSTTLDDSSPKLYRTGDYVHRQPDGALVFQGRMDRQVKVRGYRVEPGEIEAVLRHHTAVQQCTVEATDPSPDGRRLIAFFVPSREAAMVEEETHKALTAYAETHLPTYMVPAQIVAVALLPLTPNGKVDRKALLRLASSPTAAPARDAAPVGSAEIRVAGIFGSLLHLDAVGRDGHFFRLGGHSLLAARVVAEIATSLGVTLPLRALFAAPTVAELARLIEDEDVSRRFPSAVPVQASGPRRPLFLLPGAAGNATQFAALARHLGADQPCYVLEGRGRDGREDPDLTISAMVAFGIESMKSVQPKGPYALLGYSVGGLVAFEMAKQLREQGEDVPFLGILDTASPTAVRSLQDARTRRFSTVRRESFMALAIRALRHLRFRLETVSSAIRKTADYRIRRRRGMVVPEPVVESYFFIVHQRAFLRHIPRPVVGSVVLFRTEDHRLNLPQDLGWEALAVDGVDIRYVPGDHLAVLTEPGVQQVAAAVALSLASALARPSSSDLKTLR